MDVSRFAVIILTALFAQLASTHPVSALEDRARKRRPATILYQIKEGAPSPAREALEKVLSHFAVKTVKLIGNGKTIRAKITALDFPVEEVVADDILQTGAVDFAEPDYSLPMAIIVNDGYRSPWHQESLHIAQAWEVTTGSESVLIGLCDTGVQENHPGLSQNLALPGYNVLDQTNHTEPVNPHGTMMAGYLMGVAKAGRVIPVRVSNSSNGSAYLSDLAECVRWSAGQGARVVNMSYPAANSATVEAAAQYLREMGGLLFVAAGNDGLDLSAELAVTASRTTQLRSFVTVGATGVTNLRTRWSNYGGGGLLLAPGERINTTFTGDQYTSGSGTSVATAIAAGSAALLFAVDNSFSPAQVEGLLYNSATTSGPVSDLAYGNGRLDTGAAVRKAQQFPSGPVTRRLASE